MASYLSFEHTLILQYNRGGCEMNGEPSFCRRVE